MKKTGDTKNEKYDIIDHHRITYYGNQTNAICNQMRKIIIIDNI